MMRMMMMVMTMLMMTMLMTTMLVWALSDHYRKMDETGLSLDYVLFLLTSITVHIARRSSLTDLPRCQCRTSNFEIRPFSIMGINVRSVQFCFCFEFLN